MEIRRNWKILVGIFICAIGIMLNGNREAFAENIFETIADVDDPNGFGGYFVVGENRNYTYKVTPDETGIYCIECASDTVPKGEYIYPMLNIYAYNESKQVISEGVWSKIETDKVRAEAYIYMVKGKTYYIGAWTQDLKGVTVNLTMVKTDLVAQPKMKYRVFFESEENEKAIKGNYNWDSENATLTFENCEIGPCTVRFDAINSDSPEGKNYYFATDDFSNIKNIKVVFKGENKCVKENDSSFIFYMNAGYVNVGIEFTGGGTVNIDEEYSLCFLRTVGDVLLDDITFDINREKPEIGGEIAFVTKSNLKVINSTIKANLDFCAPMFRAGADIVVDDSSMFINADWGGEWENKTSYGVFSAGGKVLLNSGSLFIVADPEYISLLEENNYCSYKTPAEGIVINKDKFTIISGKDIMDLSKYKYSLENTSYIYDGKEKTPKVTIEGLVEGKHFEVEYSDNVNVGKAKFKVTGIGMFTGTIEGTFDIVEDPANKKADEDTEAETTLTDGKLIYKKLADASADGKKAGKVEVIGLKKKNLKKITVKSVVKLNGKKYKVTSIAAYAFKGNKKITKVTIGKNVRSIGKKAFFGCKKLKSVKIKSKKLKVGKKAFYRKGGKKLTIKVPKKLKNKYKKAFKKAKTNKYVIK